MNRPNFWMRLRFWWHTTAWAVGWGRRRGVLISRYAPEPFWRGLWHVFKPPPLQPPELRPGPPPWLMPSESELGVAVALREVLASNQNLVIALIDCVAFSTGFEFAIAVRSRRDIDASDIGFGPPSLRGAESPARQLHIGVQFSDGRKAVTGGLAGSELMASWKLYQEGGEPQAADGPILAHRSASGGTRRWDFRYWVWPLPPEGKLTFICEWPIQHVPLTNHDVDATAIRRAGTYSAKFWDDSQ